MLDKASCYTQFTTRSPTDGDARKYKDRFWWYLAQIFKRLEPRLHVSFFM